MKRRRIIVLAVAVALAFAGVAGPRHAQAATQKHDRGAVAATAHDERSQRYAGGKHSKEIETKDSSLLAKGGSHNPAGGQGCCIALCGSIASIDAADGLLISHTRYEHSALERSFQIAAFSAAIDPPPR